MGYWDDSPYRMCEACERGEHWFCGMQTWCECDCPGPGGDYGDMPESAAQMVAAETAGEG